MTTHPAGVRQPELASLLEYIVCNLKVLCSKHKELSTNPRMITSWIDAVSLELEGRATGECHDVVDSFLGKEWARLLKQEVDTCAKNLSAITGVSVPACRTDAGWRSCLSGQVSDDFLFTVDNLRSLPGTERVLSITQIVLLQGHIRFYDQVKVWGFKHSTCSLESLVQKYEKSGLINIRRLAWAIVGLESHKHVNLIWHQANKLGRVLSEREPSDLLAYGWIGLRTSLFKYDPSLGFKFSTYACTRITGSIRDGVRSESPVPKRLGTFGRKVAAAEAELTHSLGRSPTLEEVSKFVGAEVEKLKMLSRIAPEASVEEIIEIAGLKGGSPKWVVNHLEPGLEVEGKFLADAVLDAMSKLDEGDAEAVRLLVMEGVTPSDLSKIQGTSSRVLRQRRDRGLSQLREFLDGWSPEIVN
ncbi:MAG: sigma-70 family RNA polymerase sigma factor [Candidatus Paceibacterota bacterium]